MSDKSRKIAVELSPEERRQLQSIVRRQSVGAAKLRCARVLLLADQSHPDGRRTDASIAELVGLSTRQVVRIRQRFVRERENIESIEQACERKPRPEDPDRRLLDGEGEAQLAVIACSDPPEGRSAWTLQLICDELGRLKIVDSISPETVRQYLKKRNSALEAGTLLHRRPK